MHSNEGGTPEERTQYSSFSGISESMNIGNSLMQSLLLERSNDLQTNMKSMYDAITSKEWTAYTNSFTECNHILAQIFVKYVEFFTRPIIIRSPNEARDVIDHDSLGARTLLTGREKEVLALLAQGLSNKLVADRLTLSEGTVKLHLHRIYVKLRAKGRVQAVQKAKQLQLIP